MEQTLTLSRLHPCSKFQVKDPISTLTHFIAFGASLAGMPLLLLRAAYYRAEMSSLVSFAVFMLSMIMLYGASSAYHAFHISERGDKLLKKMDHMMIFILIAGSYTPVCTIVLKNNGGYRLLLAIWMLAVFGIGFKALWVTCPKWVSSIIYISMGWAAVFAFAPLFHLLSAAAFSWLLAGGIIYTIGGIIYATKMPLLERHFPGFGAHELFHIFVMIGSFCHFMMMFLYVTKM